ncbi:MAG: bifunctional homocysteine S-methyltransferase/methylenetetrahydrofolate reductase [Verrucomicrobium sp.]|nr:bifunctional homocysteine S-methyltransferase/methylenetetrahydrofolate reductase [Verrucomicrobium sp.]
MANLLDELEERVLIGDGATGTYLYSLGIPQGRCLEEANLVRPELVTRVYEEYIAAGARVVETNSFGANRLRLANYGLEEKVAEINWKAARLLKEAAKGRDVYVGGSVGPLQRRLSDLPISNADRALIYREQIGALLDGGCDLIFLETFTDLADLLIALDAFQNLSNIPVVASLGVAEEGRLGSGEDFPTAFRRLREAGADLVGINGTCGVQASLHLLRQLELGPDDRPAVYPNAGKPEFYEGRFNYAASPEYFAASLPAFVAEGARLIGGDYGTEPRHTAALAEAARALQPVPRRGKPGLRRAASARVEAVPAPAPAEPSLLDRLKEKPRGQATIVELDSPKNLSMEKFMEGVRALDRAGADAVTLADNSLAILRVSNVAAAVMIRRELSILPLLHIACRDRNLLGLQSDLMGLGALGFRHILALTGDPAKAGDHPGATSVYDLNSLGLIKLLAGMNRGVNAVGRDLRGRSDFVIGCAFNPNARNFDSQLRKLESKVAAGAAYVMTQPVFDPALVEKTAKAIAPLGVPVFIGVMPVLNARNAEFLHNEVPGIVIPEAVRERLRHAEGDAAAEVGLAFAKELRDEVRAHAPGLYLITPFLRYDLSVRLMEK